MVEININIENGTSFHFENEYKQILRNLQDYFNIDKTIVLDVSIVNNQKIKKLNKKYRGKDYATDILSFDFGNDDFYNELPILPIGELIISHEKVESQAIEFNHSVRREYCYLFAHGLIHLMGYDHETEIEKVEMDKMVDSIFNPLGITREE
ncbi:rRNA maturation RNase YbeY [Mycoplasma zalophidermidis]|uniref:Endoribonuclease YbeY n=1 Tax=Mycoplasma zalophidermidis TaxID=398174 RepID=A0ABS6DRY9_9MOLU|nr:rRNA maturation RNase YbeY [Mycoplasma zalophidermidis]MBU4689502.1 rRNA maturation RNase YbeY [Mycoplasma zalophidermidis]MBU4693380.1 rRNA maturation RNase YbeY [Mycoplasma zalophidermidis]MCR8966322.1 rRNA maturation RNase YbeY [Mycoplasma zalophidermidis]